MRKKLWIAFSFFTVLIGSLGPISNAAPEVRSDYIVQFVDSVDLDKEIDAIQKNFGVNPTRIFRNVFNGGVFSLNEGQARALSRNPKIENVEKDGTVTIQETQSITTSGLWGLDRVDQNLLPLSKTYTYQSTGSTVKAYVIDTGILVNQDEFAIPGGSRATFGFNAVDNNNTDCNGHGTHVAGTIGGKSVGVAKSVKLIAVKVLNCAGSGTWNGVISGIDWVIGNHEVGEFAVANLSIGGGLNKSVNTAVANLVNDGVVVSVAAGNDGSNACNFSPASASGVITVAAVSSDDSKPSWSNYGNCVELFAPGVSIYSASNKKTNAYATMSGTSMASPHVAGVAARLLSSPSVNDKTVTGIISLIVTQATSDVLKSVGSGSPNRILYISPNQ